MSLSGLYLDEDVQSGALIVALSARGVEWLTTTEAGMSNKSDEEQLRFATGRNLVMVTCNVADFARLHAEFLATGHNHSGLILIHQQKWSPGELARRIIRLLAAPANRNMRNRLEFVSNWSGIC